MKLALALGSDPLPSAQQLAFQSALALVPLESSLRSGRQLLPAFVQPEENQGWARSSAAQLVRNGNTGSCPAKRDQATSWSRSCTEAGREGGGKSVRFPQAPPLERLSAGKVVTCGKQVMALIAGGRLKNMGNVAGPWELHFLPASPRAHLERTKRTAWPHTAPHSRFAHCASTRATPGRWWLVLFCPGSLLCQGSALFGESAQTMWSVSAPPDTVGALLSLDLSQGNPVCQHWSPWFGLLCTLSSVAVPFTKTWALDNLDIRKCPSLAGTSVPCLASQT